MWESKKKKFWVLLIVLLPSFAGVSDLFSQQPVFRFASIAYYNLENLFDTIDTPDVNDFEFTPAGPNLWNTERYMTKLHNMARVIEGIGSEKVPGGPTIIALSEMENRKVLEDLINTPPLKGLGYSIIHYQSPDRRGIDVALLYKPALFHITNTTSNRLTIPWRDDFFSRDQLVVSGKLDGEMLHIIVNHWPSRRSPPKYRAEAAKLSRHLSDSLKALYPNAKVMIVGDLNDDPRDRSIKKVLGAQGRKPAVIEDGLFNPYYELHRQGVGTIAWRDAWNLFDQIIVSEPLLNETNGGWKLFDARVYNPPFLFQKDGPFEGYPHRTFAGGRYIAGFSDHLPVYVFLKKEIK